MAEQRVYFRGSLLTEHSVTADFNPFDTDMIIEIKKRHAQCSLHLKRQILLGESTVITGGRLIRAVHLANEDSDTRVNAL